MRKIKRSLAMLLTFVLLFNGINIKVYAEEETTSTEVTNEDVSMKITMEETRQGECSVSGMGYVPEFPNYANHGDTATVTINSKKDLTNASFDIIDYVFLEPMVVNTDSIQVLENDENILDKVEISRYCEYNDIKIKFKEKIKANTTITIKYHIDGYAKYIKKSNKAVDCYYQVMNNVFTADGNISKNEAYAIRFMNPSMFEDSYTVSKVIKGVPIQSKVQLRYIGKDIDNPNIDIVPQYEISNKTDDIDLTTIGTFDLDSVKVYDVSTYKTIDPSEYTVELNNDKTGYQEENKYYATALRIKINKLKPSCSYKIEFNYEINNLLKNTNNNGEMEGYSFSYKGFINGENFKEMNQEQATIQSPNGSIVQTSNIDYAELLHTVELNKKFTQNIDGFFVIDECKENEIIKVKSIIKETNQEGVAGELKYTLGNYDSGKEFQEDSLKIMYNGQDITKECRYNNNNTHYTIDIPKKLKYEEQIEISYEVKIKKADTSLNMDIGAKDYTINNNGGLVSAKKEGNFVKDNQEKTTTDVVITGIDADTKEVLPNAEITLWKNGEEIFKGKTDSNGQVLIPKLSTGDYLFKETASPDGYYNNNEEYTFNIDENVNIIGTTIFENSKIKESVILYKLDKETNNTLQGATLEILKGNEIITAANTNENGEIKVELGEGTYTYREITAPVGYQITTEEKTFEINKDGEVIGDTTLYNEKIKEEKEVEVDVIIKNIDNKTLEPIQGSTAIIYDENNKKITEEITDKDGSITISKLKPGTYTFENTKPADGYYKNENVYRFEIKKDGTIEGDTIYTSTKINNYKLTLNYIDKKTNTVLDTKEKIYRENSTYDLHKDFNLTITGYDMDHIDNPLIGTITKDTTINIYYNKQLKDYNITVKYVDKETDKILKTEKKEYKENSTYDIYTDFELNMEGYTRDSISGDESGVITENKVITVYYNRILKQYNLTVNYINKDTEEIIKTEKKEYTEGTRYNLFTDFKLDLEGYDRKEIDSEINGVINKDTVINIYYKEIVNEKNYKISIDYMDNKTGDKIKTEERVYKENTEFNIYVDFELDLEDYNIDHIDGETSGIITEDKTIKVYYNEKEKTEPEEKEYRITVKCINIETDELIQGENRVYKENENFNIIKDFKLNIDGYNREKIVGEIEGKVTENKVIEIYYREIKKGEITSDKIDKNHKITINYIDVDSKEVIKTEEKEYKDGSRFNIFADFELDMEGYTREQIKGETSGIITEDKTIGITYKENKKVEKTNDKIEKKDDTKKINNEENKKVEDKAAIDKPVQTGDNTPIMLYVGIGVLAIIGLIIAIRKKK